jgi:thymidine phosphorylase
VSGAGWDAPDVIVRKRDGQELPDDAIRWFIDAYVRGEVADEQASALCMAIFFRGLSTRELRTWTRAMIDSGVTLDLSGVTRPTVDKHSTGGVGDKVSLILCPLLAACGAAVPQLSGRALAHTGGTLDKMEAIPGWSAELTDAEVVSVLNGAGAVIAAASERLVPADRKLYQLRDITGTVPSIPLIASSIMSKKIASGTGALVLDIKVGRGAFMQDPEDARTLARTMVALGREAEVKTSALLTRMDAPLGRAVGNALEVAEAVEALAGGGPADLREVTLALAREMLRLVEIDADPEAALDDGSAMDRWKEMVRAQGGNPDAPLPTALHRHRVTAPDSGWLVEMDALAVGLASTRLGAGRLRPGAAVSAAAGIECLVKPGDPVEAGQPVFILHADDADRIPTALAALEGAWRIGPDQPKIPPPVMERVVTDD